jgi:hypothetical protein
MPNLGDSERSLVFISSADRMSGSITDFTVRTPNLIPHMVNRADAVVKLTVAMVQITFPIATSLANINQIIVHSNLPSKNIANARYTDDLIHIPIDGTTFSSLTGSTFSSVIYRALGDTHNEVMLADRQLDSIRFWLTDTFGNQLPTLASDWYITLVIDVLQKDRSREQLETLKQIAESLRAGL